MALEFTLTSLSLVITTIIAFALTIYGWQRRKVGTWVYPFVLLTLGAAIWANGYALEIASLALPTKIFWAKVQYFGIVSVPLGWLLFSYTYTGRSSWVTPNRIFLLALLPIFTLLLVWTNESHSLIWESITIPENSNSSGLRITHGLLFWLYWVYAYILLAIGTVNFFRSYRNNPAAFRTQNSMLLLATLAPWIGNALYVTRLSPIPELDLSPFGFAISGLLFALAIFRFQLFDLIPVARSIVMNQMSDGIIVLDNQLRIVDINQIALHLFQMSKADLFGESILEIIKNDPERTKLLPDHQSSDKLLSFKILDKMHIVELLKTALQDEQGQPRGHLVMLHDVTAYKESEKRLLEARDQAIEAYEFKSQFLAKVSHELRTPLNVILAYAEMVQDQVFGPITSVQEKPIKSIISNAAVLTRQVNNLLDMAQLENDRIALISAPFNVTDMLNNVVQQATPLAHNKGLFIKLDTIDVETDKVYGDSDKLTQILFNLVHNGIKFSDIGCVALTATKLQDDEWSFSVSDNGIGIPEEHLKTVFDPFEQASKSLTNRQRGVGLGLSIVKQFVELMEGRVEVKSQEDVGSTFTIWLSLPSVSEIEQV